ncbi:MAG TPA: nuclear transport factor 2 family protein [Thermoleophilaceae bacterium]|jgi:ketosteroid isomerase-like protein
MTLAERLEWMIEARNRGEIDAVLEHYLPEAEWVTSPSFMFEDVVRGRDSIRRFWQDYRDEFLEGEWTPEDVVEQGQLVVASIRYEAHGRGSGVPLRGVLHGITTFRDGKVARVEMFDSRADAEHAAGRLRQ